MRRNRNGHLACKTTVCFQNAQSMIMLERIAKASFLGNKSAAIEELVRAEAKRRKEEKQNRLPIRDRLHRL